MNQYQELWWRQARSDYEVYELLRKSGTKPCHQLHYLQMATEKLGKALLWRTGKPPSKISHAAFVWFLRSLGVVQANERPRIAKLFGYKQFDAFQALLKSVLPMAYDLQQLAPQLAENGPNPEYPWPKIFPTETPVDFKFPLWEQLFSSTRGHELLRLVKTAIHHFPELA